MNKLYETNSYMTECTATITSLEHVDGEYYVTLSDSIFFPEEGGQYADRGFLIYNGEKVRLLGGIFGADNKYKLERAIPAGTEVKCELDWDIRYDRMQNHSGEHLLTGVIHNVFGYNNVGFHLSDEGPVTLDLSGPMTYEQVIELEKVANSYIYANIPIKDSYPSKEELASIDYRSKIEIEGQVRLITIGDDQETVDVCACCAPHVKTTGEIGIIKVISVINWKGGVRISMLAGRRALEYINHEHDIIRSLTGLLTTSQDNLCNQVSAHMQEINELKGKLAQALEKGVLDRINESGVQFVFLDGDFPATSMRNIYNVLTEKNEGFVGVFAGDDENGYRYFAGSASLDSRIIANKLKEEFDAKGGGKPEMVQGQVSASEEALRNALSKL